ncbi:MAG TPA: acyl-CoA dehydrogenase family protein [Methylophilaceae bacterium]
MRDYANNRLNSSLMDARRSIPPYVILDFGNKGLLGLQAPVEYGGLDLGHEDCMAILTQIGAMDMNLAILVGLHNYLGIRPIMHHSNETLRAELLPKLASGRELAAFGLTEPGAGSNASAIESQATLMPNGNIKLNGSKMWIGNASWAGIINVFLRYTDEHGKPNGTCGYVVRQGQPGLEMGPELMTMGLRSMVQNTFTMKDVIVEPMSQLGVLGRGLDVAQDAMMYTRLALGAIFLGAMKRCLQLMLRYADRRTKISTGRLLDNPVSMMRLSTLTAKAQVLENLLHFISQRLDRNVEIPEEFLIVAKVSGSEFLWDAVDGASQMLGGRGYLENNEIAKILRDARVGRVFEGPTETMMYYMGSRLVLDSERLTAFLSTQLDAQDIAAQIIEARDAVASRCKAMELPFTGMRKLQLANFLLGEIVNWGILHAVSRYLEGMPLSDNARVSYWTQMKFVSSISAAKYDTLDEKIAIEPNKLKEIVAGFETQIGDIEQTLPGEEWGVDPYLRV